MIRRTLLIAVAAIAVVVGVTTTTESASAAHRPGVGSITLHSWTKPYHQYLRTVVFALPANAGPCQCWGGRSWVQYRIWRHTSTGWKLVKSRDSDWVDYWSTDRATGWPKDVETWSAWDFHHAGTYRWQATLHAHHQSVSTDFRRFRVYYR